uniref:Cell division cycle associated 5 n=1 Tax=Labrus bergylta TaxID=56723 RepID=A0A3Q3F543_9LABR
MKTQTESSVSPQGKVSMDERELNVKVGDCKDVNCSQRRRSPRLSSPPQAAFSKMALVKRSITVRKIAPRKTVAPSENNKENTPRRSGSEEVQKTKPKVSTPGVTPHRRGSTPAKKAAAMPSPILPSSPPPPPPAAADPVDPVWSQKVRRSYSRLSSPDSRVSMFGFERMNTPEVVKRAEVCCAAPEVDTDIPGVLLVKEKRRRRKVQQIGSTEMDALAAQMNAEFEEAEVFELFVE